MSKRSLKSVGNEWCIPEKYEINHSFHSSLQIFKHYVQYLVVRRWCSCLTEGKKADNHNLKLKKKHKLWVSFENFYNVLNLEVQAPVMWKNVTTQFTLFTHPAMSPVASFLPKTHANSVTKLYLQCEHQSNTFFDLYTV